MEFIGKHKVSGKDVFKSGDKHYTKEGDEYVVLPELNDDQKSMIAVLHDFRTGKISYAVADEASHLTDEGKKKLWNDAYPKIN